MKNQKRLSVAVSMAVVALLGGAIFGGSADAKKKGGKKSKPVTVQNNTPQPIPDAVGSPGPPPVKTLDGKLDIPLTVSKKKVKKNVVSNVAVTFQTTGLAAGAAGDLSIDVLAADGTRVTLGANGSGPGGFPAGQSVGPLTLQPNSAVQTCNYDPATQVPPPPPCADPDSTLNPPYVGTAGDTGLKLLNGSKAAGTWHVVYYDRGFDAPPATVKTSIANSTKLVITTQPVPTA